MRPYLSQIRYMPGADMATRGKLPELFLAYSPNPSDSGRIHSNVKQRWLAGDEDIVEGMKHFSHIVDQARVALEQSNWNQLKDLMTANFEQRRKLYTGFHD